tara:strand:- start:1027 stop:1557 length:531 start_codon:yes stop_codon:yes gene_type:complete
MKARKRPQRARRAAVRRRDIAPGPTPQTAAKLRRDVLLHLYEKGRLRREHLEAAEEIRRIWQAFSRSLGATATNPDTLATGRQGARARQPIEGLTGGEEAIWRNRYRPWAREMASIVCGGTVRVTGLQLVLDIVVDNRSFRQVEGCYRMRHGAAAAHLQTALHLYARIAGWVGDDS